MKNEKQYFHNRIHGNHINNSQIQYVLDVDNFIGKDLTDEIANQIKNEYCAHISKLIYESFDTGLGFFKSRSIDCISLDITGDKDYDGDFDGFTLSIDIHTIESEEEYHSRLCDETKKIVEAVDTEKASRHLLYLELKKEFEK